MIRSRYRMSMSQFVIGLGAAINEGNGVEMFTAMPRVRDRTGMTGVYEFTLEFAGLVVTPGPPLPDDAADPAAHTATDPGEVGPSLFVRLRINSASGSSRRRMFLWTSS